MTMNYNNLYNNVNKSLSLKLKNGQHISLIFDDLSTNIKQNDAELGDIYNKLNSMFQVDTDMTVFEAYNNQLAQLSLKICDDVNTKLADGVLTPDEIVSFVINALNNVTSFIVSQMNAVGTKQTDVKNLVMHYVLSLLIVVLSALQSADIIKQSDVKPVLKKINLVVTELQLVNQVAANLVKISTGRKCC